MLFAFNLSSYVHPLEVSYGKIHFSAPADAPKTLCQELRKFLSQETGIEWDIALSEQTGGLSLKEQDNQKKEHIKEGLSKTPLIAAVLKTFPGAQIDGFKLIEKATDAESSDELVDMVDE